MWKFIPNFILNLRKKYFHNIWLSKNTHKSNWMKQMNINNRSTPFLHFKIINYILLLCLNRCILFIFQYYYHNFGIFEFRAAYFFNLDISRTAFQVGRFLIDRKNWMYDRKGRIQNYAPAVWQVMQLRYEYIHRCVFVLKNIPVAKLDGVNFRFSKSY